MANLTEYRCLTCGLSFSRPNEPVRCPNPNCKMDTVLPATEVSDEFEPREKTNSESDDGKRIRPRYILATILALMTITANYQRGPIEALGGGLGTFVGVLVVAVVFTPVKNMLKNRFDLNDDRYPVSAADLVTIVAFAVGLITISVGYGLLV